MVRLAWCVLAGAMLLPAVSGMAQQPAQQPAQPPTFPPINPAAARLDQTISGLDGPGFAIAYGDPAESVIAACERGTIQVWKKDVLLGIRSGSGSGNVLRGHDGPVLAIGWNGGNQLVSVGLDRKLLFWDFREGKIAHTATTPFIVRALALAPDGKTVAIGGEDPAVELWDVDTGKAKTKLSDHADWIIALTYSADGKLLASGDFAGKVALWEMPSGKKLRNLPAPPPPPKEPKKEPPKEDPIPATALAFAPDGKLFALGLYNGTIHLITADDGKIVRSITGHTSAVTGLAFHPSGAVLASSSKDRTVRLWNPANAQPFKVLEGPNGWVEGVVFATQGTRLASVGADQTIRRWDLAEPPKKERGSYAVFASRDCWLVGPAQLRRGGEHRSPRRQA